MGDTTIQWTDKTWSPVRARVKADAAQVAVEKGYTSLVQIAGKMAGHVGPHCERVSHGCDHCYSDTNNGRCLRANGTGLPFDRRARDLVDTFIDERILTQPLLWKKPCKIFVENQADLFGEWVPDELIDRVFAIMALSPQHTFQILTKRPERMLQWFAKPNGFTFTWREGYIQNAVYDINRDAHFAIKEWPLPNVWLGISVEDQATADVRIPLLLQTPGAVRFVSYEPALGPVDFTSLAMDLSEVTHDLIAWRHGRGEAVSRESYENYPKALPIDGITGHNPAVDLPGLDWVIVGGESGPRSRPFDIFWARQTIEQCKAGRVACFVKQLGAKPMYRSHGDNNPRHLFNGLQALNSDGAPLRDKKGGDMAEWPEHLRVREFPRSQNNPAPVPTESDPNTSVTLQNKR